MRKFLNFILYAALLAACVMVGTTMGPIVRAAYAYVSEPSYEPGDFGALYREAGKPVVMFSTSTCPHCRQAREFLAAEQIDYRDFVVDESKDARQRFAALKGEVVPVLFIGNRKITGFRETAIRESLSLVRASRVVDK